MSTGQFIRGFLFLLVVSAASPALAQQDHQHEPPPPAAQPPAPQPPAEPHQHGVTGQDEHAGHAGAGGLFPAREASGTAWLPDATPMYARHGRAGAWELMGHGNVFLQYLHEEAEEHRGSSQGGSINWMMGMARRTVGAGRLGFRGMMSLEPATIPGCGYPDLLATGEVCNGDSIHDRQHPHDLFMELAAEYERPLRGVLRWQVYAGLAGEPALGPVAYPHRLSALPNPIAPIGHHWLDATHITFGVLTTGLFTQRWKVEGSLFNGREPDENRWDLDLARLDSFSGRVWFSPTPALALQVSAGHLNEAEAEPGLVEGAAGIDVVRVTASGTYHRQIGAGTYWAATLAWGRNSEEGEATHTGLLEANITRDDRHTFFGRLEITGKPAHDLHVHETTGVFTVAKLQGGYTRYLQPWRGLSPGIGGALAGSLVPAYLVPRYGSRVSLGLGVFLTLRPGPHQM